MGVRSIDWIGRLVTKNRLAVARGQGRSAEVLRASAEALAVQIRRKLVCVWGGVGLADEVRLGKGSRLKDCGGWREVSGIFQTTETPSN